jgi:hypothetical protein
MPGKILSIVIGILGTLWLGIAGAAGMWWWDRRDAGAPTWAHVHILFLHWSPPASLKAQRDALAAEIDAANRRARALTAAAANSARDAGLQDVRAQTIIRTRTITLTREVPTYVTAEADRRCIVPVGFVGLYDDAVRAGRLDAAGSAAQPGQAAAGSPSTSITAPVAAAPDNVDADSGLELSQVLTTDLGNIGAAEANAQQVRDLQALYAKLKADQAASRAAATGPPAKH